MAFSGGDYYRRLNLSPQASFQEIKTAFRRLARQYHPDLHPDKPGAVAKFRAIQEAYEVLRDRIRRQHYDQSLPQKQHKESYGSASSSPPSSFRSADECYLRGIRSAMSHDYEEAIAHYTQAIVLDGQFIEAYLRRAEVRYVLDDDSGVLVDCQRAITLHAKTTHAQDRYTIDSQIYYYQGMARYRLGYVESAIAAYSDAIRHDPEDARYFYRRGIAYQELHSYSEAFKDIKRSAQLYHDQGDLASYHHLKQVLGTFKQSVRSRPLRLIRRFTRWRHRYSKNRHPKARHPKAKRADLKMPSADSGHVVILRLLSNPAGELVPLYRRLDSHQTAVVGYGLAVLANLCFVLGAIQQLEVSSWLVASWLWASGGFAFVAMVLAVSLFRMWLRIRGPWAADIFMLGTAVTPLGLLAIVSALLPGGAQLVAGDRGPLLAYICLLAAALWAFSHAVVSIQTGLSQLHPFSSKTTAWLAPVILGTGLAAGIATWVFLARALF